MKRTNVISRACVLVLSMAMLVACSGYMAGATASDWKPTSTIEIIAPANPGGGWDMIARIMQRTLTEGKLVDRPIIITNRPGGGGATGWTYLNRHQGSGHYLAVNSSLLLLNNLLGSSDLTYKDFTVLANLETEWETVVVSADSPYKTGKEFFEALKANPSKMPIGVGPALGNDDHLQFLMLAKAYGIPAKSIKFVVYPGAGGEQIPALLGGHVKALTIGLGEVLEQHKAGKMRILGISSEERLEVLPDVPTWKEQGIDLVFAHWRGVMGPKGMTPEQVSYWEEVLSKMVQHPLWAEQLKNMEQYPFYMNAKEYEKYLGEQTEAMRSLLAEVGLIR
ncbi:MAG: tripartite tricarboxylate transporter substrate binding protein [Firmicutes bacterium]|jgi:tripartite-type tricarboxylate transporter receptor subunit TctC|nr:tripartite tricarboxylate transporter substrate binding protein [Bacillota bacterium]